MHKIFKHLLERYPELEPCAKEIITAGELLSEAAAGGNKILVCGNGGSAADADHICGELLKSFTKKRPIEKDIYEKLSLIDETYGSELSGKLQGGIPAIALTHHTALSTAFGNDVDPNMAFAQQCYVYGKKDDCFWGISTSGNAKNVFLAALTAKAKGLSVIGMTGGVGGKLASICDVCICVPQTETFKVQELHLPVYHALCLYVEDIIWP